MHQSSRHHLLVKLLSPSLALLGVTLAGCGGGSGGGTTIVGQPLALEYDSEFASYYRGLTIAENHPSVVGEASQFTISPPLPGGLVLDADTGVLSGTPTGIAPDRDYVVTASGDTGVLASATLRLGVVNPPRYSFVANAGDSTISSYAMDPGTGLLKHAGYHAATELESGPTDALMHPSGLYFFTVNQESRTISVYGLDAQTGEVHASDTAGQGTSPHEMALHPSGRWLYVTNLFTSRLRTYEFDSALGTLSEIGTPQNTAPAISGLALHPTGQFLFLPSRFSGGIQTFVIDEETGLPSLLANTNVNSVPSALAISEDGENLYITAEDFELIVRFRINLFTGLLTDPKTKPTEELPAHIELHPSGRFLYVVNSGSDSLTKYDIDNETGILGQPTIVTTGFVPQSVTFDPAGNFAYVVNSGGADMTVFRVDLANGSLMVAESMRARGEPRAMVIVSGPEPVSESSRFVYVANSESDDVASYVVSETDGSLTEIGLAPLAGDSPVAVVVDPFARFVYVANSGSNDVSLFGISPTSGQLTELSTPVPVGLEPSALAVDPSGHFLYVANRGSQTVTAFGVDQETGLLELLETEGTSNPNPISLEVDPTGQFLYVVNEGIEGDHEFAGDLTAFTIDPRTGLLELLQSGALEGGTPTSVAFDRTGKFAYVPRVETSSIVSTTIAPNAGTLGTAAQTVASLVQPGQMVVDPSGSFAYMTVIDPQGGPGRIVSYDVNAQTGTLSPVQVLLDGVDPSDIAVDRASGFVYVANAGSNDLSVLHIETGVGALEPTSVAQTGLRPLSIAISRSVQ